MNNKLGFLTVPVAILVAGVLIAASIIFAVGYKNSDNQQANVADSFDSGSVDNVKAVSDKDHFRGKLDAPIKLVEFSDLECPFCKSFHATMNQAIKDYDGKIVWVYRHFPLDAIHPMARPSAEASECVSALGGNEKFWAFIDNIFENGVPSDESGLAKIAESVGVKKDEFVKCLDSNKYDQEVEDDYQDGIATGVQGTPHSILITANGKKFEVNGAQPFANVKKIIDLALQEK